MKQTLLSTRYILLYAVIAGFLMSLTPFSLAILPNHHGANHQRVQLLDATMMLLLNTGMFFSSLWLNLRIIDKLKTQKILINLGGYLLLCGVAIFVHSPIWLMIERLPIGFFIRDEFVRNFTIFAISAVVAHAFQSFQQNQLMKNKILEIQRESLSGQIETLKQQINPHFFFNSLNTLSGLAQEDSQKTVEFIDKLSQVFRYVLDIQEKNLVTITEELEFANAYIYLMKVRFQDKFSVEILVDGAENEYIPSLCTQLLLENCFKHNGMSQQNPMRIEIKTEPGYLSVCNSISQKHNMNGNGIGLNNLNQRSLLLIGKSILIQEDATCFTVKVPTIKATK